MLGQKEMKKQAENLERSAVEKYGEMKNRKARPALEQLVMSIFCRRTSVGQATRALRELKRGFVDWNEVRVSHPAELASGLPATQWARVGAEQLVWLLRDLYERSADMATNMAGLILKRQVAPEDHARLVREALEGLKEG